jgi:hypothetical protein
MLSVSLPVLILLFCFGNRIEAFCKSTFTIFRFREKLSFKSSFWKPYSARFSNFNSNEESEQDKQSGTKNIKKYLLNTNSDSRDNLPFIVCRTFSPNNQKSQKKSSINEEKHVTIGTYLLDSTTACGDILDLRDLSLIKAENEEEQANKIFRVRKVIFLYKWSVGDNRHKVVAKKLVVDRIDGSPWGWNEEKDIEHNENIIFTNRKSPNDYRFLQ